MSEFLFFPKADRWHGQILAPMGVSSYFPSTPNPSGEPSSLAEPAAHLLSRAALAKRTKGKHGGALMVPWQGRTEMVRFLYSKGMVLIHVDDAGKPWGAALFLAIEALAPQRVGTWRKGLR